MTALVRRLGAAGVLALSLVRVAYAQTTPPPIAFDRLRESAPASTPAREWLLTLGMSAAPDAVADLPGPSSRALSGPRVRERDPQIAHDSIVVAAIDESGRTLDWQIVADPRVVRAETPGADGVLTGRTFTRERVEFSAILNAGDNAAQIVVYQPRRQGSGWLLEPIAVARTK